MVGVKRAVVARAPTRIDFGGGWTDVPPYPERDGGAVCNLAIARYATATVAVGGNVTTHHIDARSGHDALIRAALRRSGIDGAEASLSSDYPIAAGLGGSSAAGVALAGALAASQSSPLAPRELAELSRDTEVTELGVAGGYQDHYAAAFGGALLLSFHANVGVEPIPLTPDLRTELAQRAILVYTGESRISSAMITAVRDGYVAGERPIVSALARMKAIALDMAAALRSGDIDALGGLTGEHWQHQRTLHPSITTPRIDAIADAAGSAGALGIKALGASAGGCVVAIAARGREEELVRALSRLGARLEYSVDTTGFDVVAMVERDDADCAGEAR